MGILRYAGGKPNMTRPINGILASNLAVGDSVYLMENGSAVEYLVVHQGLPSSIYDASCDGCWLLRKDLYGIYDWGSNNSYKASRIHNYLNSRFLNLLDTNIIEKIKTVKIPYVNGAGSGGSVASGANGLSAQIFLLSGYEVGWTQSTNSGYPIDGGCLTYFSGLGPQDTKRIGYLNGTATNWWLRSPYIGVNDSPLIVLLNGGNGTSVCSNLLGIRPALVLPSTALFDKTTLLLKGVA